jgi:hypothetical protein
VGQYVVIGQNVLVFFLNRKYSSPNSFLAYRIPGGDLFGNIIIIICINYIIKIYIKNNTIINNNYGTLQNLNLLLKFPRARETISSKFIDNLGTRPQKDKPDLLYRIFQYNF